MSELAAQGRRPFFPLPALAGRGWRAHSASRVRGNFSNRKMPLTRLASLGTLSPLRGARERLRIEA